MKTIEVLKKIQQAKFLIKETKLKKEGYNEYSNYYYFTPEQIDKLVSEVCRDLDLFCKYDMKKNDNGIHASCIVIDLKTSESIEYILCTDIPVLKATNIAQQLGGAVTYSKRYLLMNIFDIVDNTLDFDSKNNTEKINTQQTKPIDDKKWLNKYEKDNVTIKPFYTKVISGAKSKGSTLELLLKVFKMSKQTQEEVKKDLS